MKPDIDRMLADAAEMERMLLDQGPHALYRVRDVVESLPGHVRALAAALAAAEAERDKLRLEVTHWPVWKAAPQVKPACWACDCHRVGWFHGANGCCPRCGCFGERAEKSDLLTECDALRARLAALERAAGPVVSQAWVNSLTTCADNLRIGYHDTSPTVGDIRRLAAEVRGKEGRHGTDVGE